MRCGVCYVTDIGCRQSVCRAELLAVVRALEECNPRIVVSDCKGVVKALQAIQSGQRQPKGRHRDLEVRARNALIQACQLHWVKESELNKSGKVMGYKELMVQQTRDSPLDPESFKGQPTEVTCDPKRVHHYLAPFPSITYCFISTCESELVGVVDAYESAKCIQVLIGELAYDLGPRLVDLRCDNQAAIAQVLQPSLRTKQSSIRAYRLIEAVNQGNASLGWAGTVLALTHCSSSSAPTAALQVAFQSFVALATESIQPHWQLDVATLIVHNFTSLEHGQARRYCTTIACSPLASLIGFRLGAVCPLRPVP
eukprot:534751-Amphidinium_carterae.4